MPNPNVLIFPDGAPFLTAPDGTIAPRVGNPLLDTPGTPADLTGVPLFAAPRRNGNQAVITAAGSPGPNDVVVQGLYNVLPTDVGSVLALANTQVVTPGSPAPNTGLFIVTAVIGTHGVKATKAVPVPPSPTFPDIASGQIAWVLFMADEFREGDPLAYCASLGLQLNVNTPAPGPAHFGDYKAELPPLIVNAEAGVFSKVQKV